MNEFTLIETETLVKELMDRFSAIIIIGVQSKATSITEDIYYHNFSGGMAHCIGLAKLIQKIIEKQYFEDKIEKEELP